MSINTINAMRAGGSQMRRHEMATGTAYAVVNAPAEKPERMPTTIIALSRRRGRRDGRRATECRQQRAGNDAEAVGTAPGKDGVEEVGAIGKRAYCRAEEIERVEEQLATAAQWCGDEKGAPCRRMPKSDGGEGLQQLAAVGEGGRHVSKPLDRAARRTNIVAKIVSGERREDEGDEHERRREG